VANIVKLYLLTVTATREVWQLKTTKTLRR